MLERKCRLGHVSTSYTEMEMVPLCVASHLHGAREGQTIFELAVPPGTISSPRHSVTYGFRTNRNPSLHFPKTNCRDSAGDVAVRLANAARHSLVAGCRLCGEPSLPARGVPRCRRVRVPSRRSAPVQADEEVESLRRQRDALLAYAEELEERYAQARTRRARPAARDEQLWAAQVAAEHAALRIAACLNRHLRFVLAVAFRRWAAEAADAVRGRGAPRAVGQAGWGVRLNSGRAAPGGGRHRAREQVHGYGPRGLARAAGGAAGPRAWRYAFAYAGICMP